MPLPQFQNVRRNDEENNKIMLGVIVNVITVLIGSTIGTLFKKGLPEKLTSAAMVAIGLCTVYIGISGCLEGENTIVLIISMVLGVITGTLIDIDKRLNRMGEKLENRFNKGEGSFSRGFVSASLLFCVGAMTIVGSLNAGIKGDNELLLTKAFLDLISSTILASALGIGVMFASVTVLVYQGILVLFAGFIAPFLTTAAINEITCAGSLIIIALGLNLLKITEIKVANFLPAILFAPFVLYIINLF